MGQRMGDLTMTRVSISVMCTTILLTDLKYRRELEKDLLDKYSNALITRQKRLWQ